MSDALIPLASAAVEGAQVPTVDARELHAFLEAGRDFTTWMRERIATYGFSEGLDYVTDLFPGLGEKGRGRPAVVFRLTLDMAKELAMVERSPKGREARRYFIECERRSQSVQPLAALSDPVVLRGLLLEQMNRERAVVEDLAPKAEALDRIATADGSLCRTDAAKVLQVDRKVLLTHMRERAWTYVRSVSGDEVGYHAKVAAGLLEHKTRTIGVKDGRLKVRVQVRVTPKGLAKLASEIAERG